LLKLGKGVEGLQDIYKQAMERIEGQTDDIRSLAKRTLTWITYAKRPLSIIEVQHALAVREQMTEFDSDYMPDVKIIKSACVGLVTTDEESGIIRLMHRSAQEFFQQSQAKWFPEGQSYITKICLTYLSFSTFDGAPCQTDKELEDRLEKNPFYGYAACNWGHHARESSEASQEIMSFLDSTVKMEASSQVLTSKRHQDLLGRRTNYRQRDSTKMTGLHLAAYFGIERAVDSLLQLRNYPPDLKDIYGRTPLSWAAENGHAPVVKRLIVTGQVKIDSKDERGKRPLIWATKEGHTAVVRLLLDEGADSSSELSFYLTPLSYAAKNGHTEIVQLLLDRGADIGWNNGRGATLVAIAKSRGHQDIAQLLLDRGAEP
jgi:ankyrin repeat protein